MTLKNIFYPQSVEYRYVLDSILRNNHFNPHQKRGFLHNLLVVVRLVAESTYSNVHNVPTTFQIEFIWDDEI